MNGAQVTCFGNLTRDPDKRYSNNNGTEYARINIAVHTRTGPDRQETDFFSINLYGNQMQNAMARCAKGTPVFVAGRFSHRPYQRNDGTQDCDLHIEARDFRVLHRAPAGYYQDNAPFGTEASELPQDPEPETAALPEPAPDQDLDFHDAPDFDPDQAPLPAPQEAPTA